jgi:hypothetical protein
MDNELENILKKAVLTYSGFYPGICLERLRKTPYKITVKIARIPAEIRMEDLPNTNLKRHS